MSTHLDSTALDPGQRDAGLPAHFGDPLREQRMLTESAGVVDRSNRDVLRVDGAPRLSWLHTITSQHLSGLQDGDSTEGLVLSPRGHVEQHWQLTDLGGSTWLDTEPGEAATVLAYLTSMIFLTPVQPADVTADWAVVSLVGPKTPDVLAAAGLPIPGAHRAASFEHGFVRRMTWPGPDAADLVVTRTELAATIDRLVAAGAARAGMWAFEALRVASRTPRLGMETDHRTIPHEVGWIGTAVHLDKGCYRGQETVARVQNLGAPPRRLVLLHLAGESDELPAPGTPIELDGRPIGFVGTAVHHYELGPIALAVVKRTVLDDAALVVAGSAAAVAPA